jgi:hypothetical protein
MSARCSRTIRSFFIHGDYPHPEASATYCHRHFLSPVSSRSFTFRIAIHLPVLVRRSILLGREPVLSGEVVVALRRGRVLTTQGNPLALSGESGNVATNTNASGSQSTTAVPRRDARRSSVSLSELGSQTGDLIVDGFAISTRRAITSH